MYISEEQASINDGISKMQEMAEWLSMTAKGDWFDWISRYEECPIDHDHIGDSQQLFVEMMEYVPDFEGTISAWKGYSLAINGNDCAIMKLVAIEKNRILHFEGSFMGHNVRAFVNIDSSYRINALTDILEIMNLGFDGLMISVDGVEEYRYGHIATR